MIIGIDHGNGQMKTANTVFSTGLVSCGPVKPAMDDDNILKYNDNYYTLSDSRKPYLRDKTTDDDYFILTLMGIANEIVARKAYKNEIIPVSLALGLPPGHCGPLKDRFKDYFMQYAKKELVFERQNMIFKILIDEVYVYPQAVAAIVASDNFKEVIKDARRIVVDIGGYTVDVCQLKNGKANNEFFYSLEKMGIIDLTNKIILNISSLMGITLEDYHILEVLRGNVDPTYPKSSLSDNIKDIIIKEAETHSKEIINKLKEYHLPIELTPVSFVGGGSILLEPYIKTNNLLFKSDIVKDVKANAKGFEKLALADESKKTSKN